MNACLFSFLKACICIGVHLYLEDSCSLNDDGLYMLAFGDVVLFADVRVVIDMVLLDDTLAVVDVVMFASLARDNGNRTEP
jgi:hypothetical protein